MKYKKGDFVIVKEGTNKEYTWHRDYPKIGFIGLIREVKGNNYTYLIQVLYPHHIDIDYDYNYVYFVEEIKRKATEKEINKCIPTLI